MFPEAYETWSISHTVKAGKDFMIFTPTEHTEGYKPMKMEIAERQIKQLWRQIAATVPFRISHRIVDCKHVLLFQADPEDKKATHNTKTCTISHEQWEALRFSCMTAVDTQRGITKLCYL